MNSYVIYKKSVKYPHLRILKLSDTLIKELTCYNYEVSIASTAASNADTSDVSQYACIDEFHSLENIGPTASKSFFCGVEYVFN